MFAQSGRFVVKALRTPIAIESFWAATRSGWKASALLRRSQDITALSPLAADQSPLSTRELEAPAEHLLQAFGPLVGDGGIHRPLHAQHAAPVGKQGPTLPTLDPAHLDLIAPIIATGSSGERLRSSST